MVPRWRVAVVLAIIVTLTGVAVPPVIEDHLEAGFCSAECPVQQAGHGTGITTPVVAIAVHRTPVISAPLLPCTDAPLATATSLDAPRAPPFA
jgi:hypothetical protein